LSGGELEGVARLTDLGKETNNPICNEMLIVNTAGHATPGVVEEDSYIGLVPTGNEYESSAENTLNNLGKLGNYKNTEDDNSIFYTPNLTKECIELFVQTRPETNPETLLF
jgi:hypothetical protein